MSPAVWPAGMTAPPVITTWSVAADALPAASRSASSAESNATIAARTAWGVDIWTLLGRGFSPASHPVPAAARRRSPFRRPAHAVPAPGPDIRRAGLPLATRGDRDRRAVARRVADREQHLQHVQPQRAAGALGRAVPDGAAEVLQAESTGVVPPIGDQL